MLYDGYGDLDLRAFPTHDEFFHRQLRIVLSVEDKLNYLEHPIPAAPVPDQAGQQVAPEALTAHVAWKEGQSISSYFLKMKSYIDNLEHLGHPMTTGLGVSPILISLRKEFDSFVQNYNMHNMGKTINELHAMLKLHDQTLPKNNGQNQRKEKNKLAYAPKPKIPPPPKREDPAKDSIYHQCGKIGHWKMNCPQYSRNNMFYISDVPRDGIFKIDLSDSYTNVSSMYALSNKRAKSNLDSALVWRCRLGHISKKCIKKLQLDGLLNSTDLRAFEKCVPCMSGKMARKSYAHKVERAKDLLGLIHTDVCGPFKIVSRQEASYFVTFTDDFSRYGYVYLLKHNHEVFETFKCVSKGSRELSRKEKQNPTRYGSIHDESNNSSKVFWDYALETAARILNMVPTKKVKKTPYEVWHGQAPKLSYIKVWGCEALDKRYTLTKPDKLEPKSIKCIFIGYPKETMGYSFYYPPENKVLVARNAEFLENNHMCLYIDVEEHELGDLDELANYKDALLDPESDKWLNVMNVEMQSMKDNEVWDLVKLPPNGKNVGSNWLFKNKTDMDGAVHTYKARLVVKGYTQTSWIDYEETFSSIADIRVIRILIAIVAFYDYEIWQINVKTVFLNGYLSKESAKQSIFATSFVEAEYIAAYDASKEAVWVRKFIYGLGVVSTIEDPMNMYCDNT
nr:retrotransposon protein, putative, Ty1-copia subclass [Tanacetum cinerariifolium]